MVEYKIVKRDGTVVDYNPEKIMNAIMNASSECETPIGGDVLKSIFDDVESKIESKIKGIINAISVEDIQDIVESAIMTYGSAEMAKLYITYRHSRKQERKLKKENKSQLLTDAFISKYKHLPFPGTNIGLFTFYRTYSRWNGTIYSILNNLSPVEQCGLVGLKQLLEMVWQTLIVHLE